MGYDLFNVPDGYGTDLALVIAPYFDDRFAQQLIKKMNPSRLRFLLDDGASNEEVHSLYNKCGARDVKIALGAVPGIVHFKGFYLEFVKASGRARRKRRFIFGSANATEAAFGGRLNAELIACVDLSAGQDQELLDYLTDVLKAVDSQGGHVASLGDSNLSNICSLRLPSFRVSPIGSVPGFDTWLQRGRLAAKYREAQQFMTVAVTLIKQLPQEIVATTFARRGLMQQGGRNVVRYPYVGDTLIEEDDDDDNSISNWKARFSVWTQFGDWISEECFKSHHSSMHSNAAPRRKARLAELVEHSQDSKWKLKQRDEFTNTIKGVWNDLKSIKENPMDYLKSSRGSIDLGYYIERFEKKLAGDLLLASDEEFCSRYVSGYDFPGVPKFRQDTAAWDSFVQSWCQSIVVEAGKTSSQSLIFKSIEPLVLFKRKKIVDQLRSIWDKEGESISLYFK